MTDDAGRIGAKALPSDEERLAERHATHYDCNRGKCHPNCSVLKLARDIKKLVAQVRAEASQEKDAEIERLKAESEGRRKVLVEKADEVAVEWRRAESAEAEHCHHGWRGAPAEPISTPCPACGLKSLFIASGGHLTCASVPSREAGGCTSPIPEEVWKTLKAERDALREENARLRAELEQGR